MNSFLAIISVLCFMSLAQTARILGIFHIPSRSHHILGSALLRELAEKGHDVTMVSPFSEKTPPKHGKYRDVVLTGLFQYMQDAMSTMNMFEKEDLNPITNVMFVTYLGQELTEKALKHQNFQNLIKSGEKFDVVIVEQFQNDAFKALAKHFGASLITFSTIGSNYWINPLVSNPSPPSYVPCFILDYSSKMSFIQRITNTFVFLFNQILHHVSVYPKQNEMIKKYISESFDLEESLYNSSVVLLNSHPSTNQPVPLVPNMIDIGGFHVKPSKKLPKDLQQFLDNATDGAIYVSFGSNLKSADLPVEKRQALISAFSKLKEQVLWKWEEDTLDGKPSNVKLGKWLPQQDILAHPNVKVFITHGGLLSTTETIYYGVPVLAVPIFGDQKLNAKVAVNGGFGLSLPYKELTLEKLNKHLDELLQNPKYRNNAKMRSKLFHDRPIKPLDLATYWVEYVLRYGGASHLRVAGLELSWYKYLLLDIVVFVVVLGFGAIFVGFVATKYFLKRVFSATSNKLKFN